MINVKFIVYILSKEKNYEKNQRKNVTETAITFFIKHNIFRNVTGCL